MVANAQDDHVTLVTREGYKKLVAELEELKNVKRREIAGRIKEAISYGDLSENSEYEEAKNEQAFIEGRILDLEEKVKSAKFIDEKHKKGEFSVQLGSKIRVKKNKSSKIQEYIIVGATEADYETKISNESPVGSALLDQKVGSKVKVVIPAGVAEYEIVAID